MEPKKAGHKRERVARASRRQSFHSIIRFAISAWSFRVILEWVFSWSEDSMRPTGLDYFLLFSGAVAQLGERLICTQEVAGSIPTSSTRVDPTGL